MVFYGFQSATLRLQSHLQWITCNHQLRMRSSYSFCQPLEDEKLRIPRQNPTGHDQLIPFRYIADQRIQQSDWMRGIPDYIQSKVVVSDITLPL